MADQNSIKTIMTIDNKDVTEKLKQLESYYKSTYSGWIEATDKLKVKDQELISAKNSLAISTKALKEEQAKGTAANKDEIVILKQAVATHKDTVQVLNLEKSALTAVTAAHTKEMATSQQAMMIAKNLNKTKQEAATADVASMKAQYSRLYENTKAQNAYNDSVERLKAMRTQGVITQNQYVSALAKETETLKAGAPERDNQFNHMIRMLRWAGTLAGAYYALNTVWTTTLGKGVELNRLYESQSLGLSAILASKTKMIDANGKEVTGVEKLNTAQTIMADTLVKIKEAATKTPATFAEMVGFYQQSIGHALTAGKSFGKNISEISDNTIKLTQRMSLLGGAIGMPMDRINEEIRSLMSGNASTDSLIASLLFGSPGAANKAIKEAKTRTDGLTKLFDGVLKDVDSLMGQNTFDMLKNNLISTLETIQKASAKPIFDDIKVGFSDLEKYLSIHSVEISSTIETMYKQIKIGAGSLGSAVGEGVSVSADFLGALVGIAVDSVDTMNDKYRKINLGDIMVLGVTTGIEALRNLVDMGALAVVEIGAMFNGLAQGITGTFEQINRGGAFMAGTFGSSKDATDFSKGADYWKRKTSDLKTDSKAFDQASSAILKEMSETDIRLAKAYNGLLLKDTSVTGGNKDANQKRLQEALAKLKAIEAEKVGPTASEIAKADRAQLKAFELMKQKHDAELTYQQMLDVQKQSSFTLEESKLTDIQKLKLSNMRMELEGYGDVFAEAMKISNEQNREKEIAILIEKYAKDSIAYGNEKLSIQKSITAEMDRQTVAADKLAAKHFENASKLADLQSRNNRESPSFERTFGMSKISQGTADTEISKRIGMFNLAMWGTEPTSDIYKAEEEKLNQMIERIKSKVVEIPPIDLKVSLSGWDTASSAVGGMISTVAGLNNATESYNATLKVLEDRKAKEIKDGADISQTNKDLANLKANNAQDELSSYAELTHAVSTFAKVGSKEQKTLLQVEQGIHMAKMAMSIQAMVMDEAMTAKQIVLSGARATADGVAAVAKTIASIPFPFNIAAGAAVAAMLVSLGIKMFGGGGGGSTPTTYTTTTGTVLGEGTSGQSESVTKLTDLMSSIHVSEYSELRDINRAVTSMAANIESAVTNIFKTGLLDTSGVSLQSSSYKASMVDTALLTGGIGLIADKLTGGLVSNVVTSLLGALGLGGSSKQYIAGSGFNIGSGTLSSKAGGNVGASTFIDIETASKNFWGSASYSHNITTTALDDASSKSIALIYKSFSDTMLSINDGLATDLAPAISNYTLDAIKLNLQGKTGEETVKALNDAFSAMGDKMTSDIFGPIIDKYQKLGEGLLQTAVRVITEKAVVMQGLGDIGKTVNGDIIGVSQSLVTLSGTLGDFQDSVASYYDKYFTDSEKQTRSQEKLSAVFSELNLVMPTSNQGFRTLVDAIDLTTLSGQEAFTTLMGISDTFYTFSDTLTKSMASITEEAQTLSNAFTSMGDSIQETIDKLIGTSSGTTQSSMIASFWNKRTQADTLLAKRGDLTAKEQSTLQGLVTDLDSLALSIQGAQVGATAGITSSLVGQLQGIQASVNLDNTIVKSLILDANGQTVDVATEGTLTRLTNAITNRNALLGIDGSHANGLDYVPYDGYIAQLHEGERVLTAGESASGYGARFNIMVNTSALEAINNKIYDRLSSVYNILNDSQLGVRPLYTRAI